MSHNIKTFIAIILAGTFSSITRAQEGQQPNDATSEPIEQSDQKNKNKNTDKEDSNGDYGWSEKIGFIVGAGMNNSWDDIFAPPTIDRQNGTVQMELAQRFRANMSFGISYTFGPIRQVTRTITIFEPDGTQRSAKIIHRSPYGISTTIFINPGLFSNLSSSSIATTADLGFGLGFRNGPWAFYPTLEVFRVSQPRSYFIERYWNTDQQYAVNGEVQSGIDLTDSSIFLERTFIAVGFKLCYTLQIFKTASSMLADTPKLQ